MKSVKRRQFLLVAGAAATASSVPLAARAGRSVVPQLPRRNAYIRTNLAASNAKYGTP